MDISPIRGVTAQCCARIPRLRWGGRGGRHIPQQRRQGAQHSNIDAGSSANPPCGTCPPIEHPSRHFQPTIGCPTRKTATEKISASLLDHLMNMHQASGPRMPRIKKLVLRDPVGVPSSYYTTRFVLTARLATGHPPRQPSYCSRPDQAPLSKGLACRVSRRKRCSTNLANWTKYRGLVTLVSYSGVICGPENIILLIH